jgi:hypothetical protein
MEQKKFVVFLRERKQGAGHGHALVINKNFENGLRGTRLMSYSLGNGF